MEKLKVLELFAGIGACSKALTNLGIEHEIVDAVEIDKYAVKSFNAIHGTNFEPQDITNWDKDVEIDLLCHGSPCTSFSISGKQEGGDKGSGTPSSLMYDSIRIIEKLKPKYVIWENVKNILSAKHKHNFDNYCTKLEQLGYNNYYQVLNSKDYNIPQNRERVFTISVLNELNKDFKFPQKQELKYILKDLLEDIVDEKYYLTEKNIKHYQREFGSKGKECKWDGIAPTLQSAMGTGGGNVPILKQVGVLDIKGQDCLVIRKLTPKECWRLMGFSDNDFEKASKVNSNSQLYKQAGNSIVVNVLMAILEKLLLGD